jgi:hypothetical protein
MESVFDEDTGNCSSLFKMFQDGESFNYPGIRLAESSCHIPWIPAKNMPE